jgi:protein required for attachment to host cells
MQIPHDTLIVIADGSKYLLLRNFGDADLIDLRIIGHEDLDTPPARDLATDRPGRMADTGVGQRSALEQTDWHTVAEVRFADHIAERLNRWALQDRYRHLLVIADPRTLGRLRQAWHETVRARLLGEVDRDLTNMPVPRIEALLAAHEAH